MYQNKKIMAYQKTLIILQKNFAFFTLTKVHKTLIKRPKNSKNFTGSFQATKSTPAYSSDLHFSVPIII